MTLQMAETELSRLEASRGQFDDDRIRTYAKLVEQYLAKARTYIAATGFQPLNAIVDTTVGVHVDIPDELEARLHIWAKSRGLSPMAIDACRYHLKRAMFEDRLDDDVKRISDIYQPLMELLCLGGDFYIEHDAFCIRDAASIVALP